MLTLPVLASWVVSPRYLADTNSEPGVARVILVEQLAEAPDKISMQAPSGLNVTVPVGVDRIVKEESVTVAVQVVAWPITIVFGVHSTFVVVGCTGAVVTFWEALLGDS
jgi:hypothetical protein